MDFLVSCTSKVDLYVFYGERNVQFLWSMGHHLISSMLFFEHTIILFLQF